MKPLSIICCFNDKIKLHKYLLASPDIDNHEVILVENPKSVPEGYNHALNRSKNSLVLCVHQDVILPHGFFDRLFCDLEVIQKISGDMWGVVGAAGVSEDKKSFAYLYDCCRPAKNGEQFPAEVRVLDELFLLFRKDALRFDENIPSKHHFHGVDICLLAKSLGFANYVTGAYCLHMSQHTNNRKVDIGYLNASYYIRKKWWNFLPIHTTTMVIREDGDPKRHQGVRCLCPDNHD